MQLPFHLRPKSLAAFFLSSCSELTLFYIWAGGQKLISQIIPDGFPPNFVPFSSDHQAYLVSLMLIVPHQSNHSSLKLTGTHVGLNKICPTETPLCSISCWPQLPLTPRPTTCIVDLRISGEKHNEGNGNLSWRNLSCTVTKTLIDMLQDEACFIVSITVCRCIYSVMQHLIPTSITVCASSADTVWREIMK